MIIKDINVQCVHSDINSQDIYLEISRIRDRSKIYNSPRGYFGNYQRKGNVSWAERLPKIVNNHDSYLLLCLNKEALQYHAMKYTTFCPNNFEAEKPNNLRFEVDMYEVFMEVAWE
ncbi:MAG: hypothetical protein AB8B69_13025 [Chitinophagales bacterium]